MVWKTNQNIGFFPLPVPELLDIGSRARSVQAIGGLDPEGFTLVGSRTTEWVDAFRVTANLFDVLEVHAIQGRTFVPDDGLPGREHVAVIGEALWRRAFGSDPGIIGKRVQLKAEGSRQTVPGAYEIVGVVASDLELFYPTHLGAELYVPRVLSASDHAESARSMPSLFTFARTRPGVGMSAATAEIRSVLATALIAGLLFGLAPAITFARPRLAAILKARSGTTTSEGGGLRHLLVVVETALVLALLASAALIGTGVWRLTHVPIGFQPKGVLVAQLKLPARVEANDHGARFERELLARLRGLPGVVRASTTSELPFTWGVLDSVKIPGSDAWHRALVTATGGAYLRLLDVPLRDGRLFGPQDEGNRHVVVINEALKRLLPGGQVIGQHVQIDKQWREVVGVVGDITEVGRVSAGVIRRAGTSRVTLPAAYVPIGTYEAFDHFLVVRTAMTSAAADATIRQVIRAIDPEVTLRGTAPLEDRVTAAGTEIRFCALLVSVFAGVAMVLSAVGLFGVLAHSVGQRTREIGIHMALGARPGRVRWIVARRALGLVGSGAVIGLGITLAGGRAIRSFLFEVAPADPWILGGAATVLLGVAAFATWIPVRRAGRVDPTTALKCE
jgi:hypothetical protein